MKNLKIYAMLLMGVATMSSCSDDLMQGSNGEGWIQLSGVTADKTLTTATRADGDPVMSVDILDEQGNSFMHADDWTTIAADRFLVKAGNKYTVKAYSAEGNAEAEGFDVAPYYEGSADVTVTANHTEVVEVNCPLAQAKLSVNYSEAWTQFIEPDFTAEVVGTPVMFVGEESRAAFLKAGRELKLRLIFKPKGKAYATTLEQTIVASTKAATHYKVNVNVSTDGKGNITVEVDQTVHEYEVSLGVPVENNGIMTTPVNGDYSRVWGTSATLSGYVNDETGAAVEFLYGAAGTDPSSWTSVAATKVGETSEYTAEITGLSMGTSYDYKIKAGEQEGDVCTFTTEKYVEIPNMDFENWAQDGKSIWYPNAVAAGNNEDGVYWSTGNEGVQKAGKSSITTPVDDPRPGSVGMKCAEMHTITGVMLAKSASGNLFIGSFKTNLSSPKDSPQFGRPYTGARPRKLKGWYKYTPAAINEGTFDDNRGITTDEANIYLKVWAADGSEIGFGELVESNTVSEWREFSFDVTYTDTTKPAAKMTIVATSSRYGGVFSGSAVIGKVGNGSQLYVDDFELEF